MKKIKEFFKDHDLVKILLASFLFCVLLTWLIPGGKFSGTEFVNSGYGRFGLNDIFISGVYGINYFIPHFTFIVVLGVFYGVLSKVPSYQALVTKVTGWIKGKEVIYALAVMFLLAAFASMTTNLFATLLFVPFLISVFTKAKLDKITTFSITFGAILIGLLGSTVNTELESIISYLGISFEAMLLVKIVIFFIAFALFGFFVVSRIKEQLKSKNVEVAEEVFEVESNKKAKVWPMIVILSVLAVIQILGFIGWNNVFGIDIFDRFHEWLVTFSLGDYSVISFIIGSTAGEAAFGIWDLFTLQTVMFIATIVFAFMAGRKGTLSAALDGAKKMLKPLLMLLIIYAIFVVIYWTPFISTICNWILGLSKSFNVFLTALVGLICGIFNADFALTGMNLGTYFASNFADSVNVGSIVFSTMNGLAKMFTPVSVMLMIGLSYLGITYKSWFKYIWKFLVGMLIVLLIIFTMLAYI